MAENSAGFGSQQAPDRQPIEPTSTHPDVASSNQASENQHLEQLSQEMQELKQASLVSAQQAKEEAGQLRNQVRWLSGLLVAVTLILGGAFVGTFFSLRNTQSGLQDQQEQLADRVQSLEESGANVERLDQLEKQLETFNRQTQDLVRQVRGLLQQVPQQLSPNQLEGIQERLQELESSVRDNLSGEAIRGRLNDLNETLQESFGGQSSSEEGSSEAPNNSESGNSEQN